VSRRTKVILRDTAPSRTSPTFTGVGFVASIPNKGLFDPAKPCRSMDEIQRRFGDRQTFSVFWDWCELFFRDGGRELYVLPVRGPAAAKATLNLAGTGTTLIVNAKSAGEWGNGAAGGLTAEVANGPSGGTHRVIIIRLNGVEVERTPEFNDRALAPAFSDVLEYVDIVAGGGSGLPNVAAAANLAGGTLDRVNITQTQIDAGIDLPQADVGPGQIAAPDWPTTATHGKLLSHGQQRNRFALCDTTDTNVKATVSALANAIQGNTAGPYGALVHPWVIIAGTAGGSSRFVPASAYVAAKANQVDLAAGPGQAPAGEYGRQTSSLVQGLRASYTDVDAADLEAVGANLLIMRNGEVRFDGNRSLVEPGGPDSEWLQIGVSRLRMALVARAEVDGQGFEHILLTRINIAKFDTALTGTVMGFQSQLFPADDGSDPGWVVVTDESVNTPETIQARELNAAIGFRPAPGADMAFIYLTKVDVGQPVG
jgi:hypothetical protein